MFNEEATRILARELHRLGHITVLPSSNLATITQGARSWALVSKSAALEATRTEGFDTDFSTLEATLKKKQPEDSNYAVCDFTYYPGTAGLQPLVAFTTYYAIITPLEERLLRETFYKDVPLDVQEAMDTLEMRHFIEEYRHYSAGDRDMYNLYRHRDFLDFVFSLPAREQNLEANKTILTNLCSPSYGDGTDYYASLMERLYLRKDADEMFMTCFSGIHKEKQEAVAERIAALPKKKQKKALNLQIHDLGFSSVFVEPIELYHRGARQFMPYFRAQDEEMQKRIITALIPLDKRNAECDDALERKYHPLLEECGMRYVGDGPDGI